ncbi:25183_t:CDS:2, partial [Racocetra persica]
GEKAAALSIEKYLLQIVSETVKTTKLFSVPEDSSRLISAKLLLLIDSSTENNGNKLNNSFGKDSSLQKIIHENQNNDKAIDLVHPEPVHSKQSSQFNSSSNCLNHAT